VEVISVYGLTRAATTLIGVLAAGLLLWLGTRVLPGSEEATSDEYWATVGLVAAAGLTMALSQLLGGWTKWGWPRVSGMVFLLGFLPALILGGWLLAGGEPGSYWLGRHVRGWSDDIGIDGFVGDLKMMFPAIAFGIGLVFGFTFDTTGPRVRTTGAPAAGAVPEPQATDGDGDGDERRVHIREGGAPMQQEPEPAPRSGRPPEE
jgi:hypothetical protein